MSIQYVAPNRSFVVLQSIFKIAFSNRNRIRKRLSVIRGTLGKERCACDRSARRRRRPESIVGVLAEASLELQLAVWDVLRAGGAYLPLSPQYPGARLRYSIEDSGASVILTTADLIGDANAIAPEPDAKVIVIEDAAGIRRNVCSPVPIRAIWLTSFILWEVPGAQRAS